MSVNTKDIGKKILSVITGLFLIFAYIVMGIVAGQSIMESYTKEGILVTMLNFIIGLGAIALFSWVYHSVKSSVERKYKNKTK